ncbi:MAG: phosphoribosylanthranilate isomerase [Candidatus Nitrotoga sp.]|nr:phosphoribosylanthranilate isomerase [Candidatus Nitrotoga sp.]MBP0117656.1 phosphoribosylanthranilate isomerase [Candidatus Nitrotoga sp.]MBP0125669.1 phosphoribosylanthranilate isomerase [Candidatus Nitrotoga sp.]
MIKIKICGITRKSDLLAAVRCGADAIGLVFYEKSPRYVTLEQAAELARSIPPFVTLVGLFVNANAKMVQEALQRVPLSVLQFHGDENPTFCAQFGRPYLKAVRVNLGVDLIQYATRYMGAQGLLLDAFVEGEHGGTGVSFDWTLIPHNLSLPIVLSGGLDASNVANAIRRVKPWAVDVSSGVETAKGIKNAVKIAAFIDEVENSGI